MKYLIVFLFALSLGWKQVRADGDGDYDFLRPGGGGSDSPVEGPNHPPGGERPDARVCFERVSQFLGVNQEFTEISLAGTTDCSFYMRFREEFEDINATVVVPSFMGLTPRSVSVRVRGRVESIESPYEIKECSLQPRPNQKGERLHFRSVEKQSSGWQKNIAFDLIVDRRLDGSIDRVQAETNEAGKGICYFP